MRKLISYPQTKIFEAKFCLFFQIQTQILALKYENLWDPETIDAIRAFLNLDSFSLPSFRERGYDESQLSQREILFKKEYNLGTNKNPKYSAYNQARILWKRAPAFQFLEVK